MYIGTEQRSQHTDLLKAGRFGVRTRLDRRDFIFYAPVQTGPGVRPAFCTTDTRVPSRGKEQPEPGNDHPTPWSAGVNNV